MTIYRQEATRRKKGDLRSNAKPAAGLTRKISSLKSLPPIYEIDEEGGEIPFDLQNRSEFRDYKLGGNKVDCEKNIKSCSQPRTTARCEGNRAKNTLCKATNKQKRCFTADRKETCGYIGRHFGSSPSGGSHAAAEGINQNQAVFPDFFPRGMLVHCAQNALPEASKGLYMKIMQADYELKYVGNCYETSVTTNVNNAKSKRQNWMQFFG